MKPQSHNSRRAVAGVLGAIILFAMLFTVGAGYFLFINQSNQISNQANATRQASALQASQEQLALTVSLCGAAGPWCSTHTGAIQLSILNTGGVPATIASVFAKNNGQNAIIPPAPQYLTSTPSINISLPLSIPAGGSTSVMTGCGAATCTIGIPTTVFNPLLYSYSNLATISVLTGTGNVFTAQYPAPALTTTTQVIVNSVNQTTTIVSTPGPANALVVQMIATPTQVFSAPVTNTVTVYNYGNTPATGVAITMNTPTVTGTASLTVASGCSPSPQNIGAYSGSGNAPSVTFSCVYNAQTGAVGGFASFSGFAVGTISGNSVSSAEAISNTIQIGGTVSVTTQGAFTTDFFFFEYSACTTRPPYASACPTNPATMPPTSTANLVDGQFISGGGNQYVAYYVTVTNNLNATLPILQYSYLFLDPGISGEQYIFLVGPATNPQVPYYPNYCPGAGAGCTSHIPTFTPYTATAATCAESPPLYNPPPPTTCIDVAPGQTVTLTFAACGFGASNWAWGGALDASSYDSSTGCSATQPSFVAPEGLTLGIVLSYIYNNNVYSQFLPFEGQIVFRSTATAVSCAPSLIPNNAVSSCTVTVSDTDGGTTSTPTGTVTLSASPSTIGTFSSNTCVLAGGSCSVTFTPTPGMQGALTASADYPGDRSHFPSSGSGPLSVTPVLTTSLSANPIIVGSSAFDSSTLTSVTPTAGGTMTYNYFNGGTCSGGATVVSTVTVTNGVAPNSAAQTFAAAGAYSWNAVYSGDANNLGATSPCEPLTVNKAVTSTAVSCAPTTFIKRSTTTCTATVTGFLVPVTGETITWSQTGGTGSVSFSGSCALSAGGVCSVTVTGTGAGTATVQASYPGDAKNLASSGTSSSLTINPRVASIAQSKLLCSGTAPGTSTCMVAMGSSVTSGNVLVIAVGTERTASSTCRTVSSVSDTRGNSYNPAQAYQAANGGVPSCVDSEVWYATVGSNGADTITVQLTGNPNSWAIYAYEVSGIATVPAGTQGRCTSGCSTAMSVNPSLTYSANSFLVAVGNLYTSFITSGPASFIQDQNAGVSGNAQYIGHRIPGGGATSTFGMTANGNPNSWAEVVVNFAPDADPNTLVSCTPVTLSDGSNSLCTASLTGYSGSITGQTITWSQTGGSGSVVFPSSTCIISSDSCSVAVTASSSGSVVVRAFYGGDTENAASMGTADLTITPNSAAVAESNPLIAGVLISSSLISGVVGLSLVSIKRAFSRRGPN